ncbi:MAG: hypothetical protein HN849_17470, partial [Victivallales bacterium]|nr:hypothetical protein [Victivallales bacterium]
MVCARRLVVGFLILVAGIVGGEEPASAPGAPFVVRMGFQVAADAGREEPLLLRTGSKQAGFTVEVSTRGVAVWTPQGKHGRWQGRVPVGEHELILRARPDSVCVVLDGERRLSLPAAPPPGRTQAAVKSGKGIVPIARPRVQRLGEIHFADDFARGPNAVSLWETTGGHFALNASRTPGASQGAFDFWGVAPGSRGLAVAKGSHWFWNDCEVAVSGRGSADSAWGLVTGYRDAKNWRAVVVDPRLHVVRVMAKENGKERILHSEDLPVQAGQWYRLTVALHDGWGAAFLNGHRLLAGEDSRLTGGRIGLLVETSAGGTAGAGFDDLVVRSLDSPGRGWVPPRPFGPSETSWADFSQKDFSADQFMTQWAHPRAIWDEKAEGLDWFRTRFFHDARFVWKRSSGQRIAYPLQVALFAETGKPDSGYRLVLDAKQVALFRAGKQVGSAPHSLPRVGSLDFSAVAGQIRILLDGKEAVSWRDPAPLTSGRVGAKLGRTYGLNVGRADWRDTARVESSHRIDYGFDRAPVAWESPDAVWRATHRWACVPKWSFFGGRGGLAGNGAESANATLWNLRQFKGDFDLELFVAPMEGTPQRVHFASPTNINVVFGATGTDYDSGYLLNFGLYDTPTRLFRAGKEIAKWDGRVDPDLRRHAMPLYHKVTRVWQQIRVQRRGSRILVDVAKHSDRAGFLGMERVFDLQDSAPLNGERLGIWSHGPNGLALARATVSFAESPGAIPLIVPKAPPRAPGGPKQARTAVNRVSGGARPLWLGDLPGDLAKTGMLACPIRISPDQHASLFVHLRGQVAEVVLTGPMGGRETTVLLGRGLPDTYRPGTWAKLSFDLGTALRKHFPDGPLIPTAIGFDSPYTSFAEIAGLGA